MYVSLCRLSCLSTCLDLVNRCCALYKDLVSFACIFQPIRTLLSKHLPAQSLPEPLQVGANEDQNTARSYSYFGFSFMVFVLSQELHGEILEAVSSAPVAHSRLVLDKKKPIPLKLLTPKIVEV